MPDLRMGRQLGDFRIEGLIGRGSFGKVYRAHQISLDRPVALKVLEEGVFTLEETKQRFLRESEYAASLEHPNIVPVYTAGLEGNLHYFAMRFIEGDSLEAKLKEGIPLRKALRWTTEILSALEYIHERGMIHRDLKPANILITGGSAMLTDFGLARLLETTTITGTGVLVGTPRYFSPEQARMEKATAQSDVFAVGILLYEMVVGRHPFLLEGEENLPQKKILERIRRSEFQLPRAFRPELSSALERILLRALRAPDIPAYESTGEMRTDLLDLHAVADLESPRRPTRYSDSPDTRFLTRVPSSMESSAADETEGVSPTVRDLASSQNLPISQTTKVSKRSVLVLVASGALLLAIGAWMLFGMENVFSRSEISKEGAELIRTYESARISSYFSREEYLEQIELVIDAITAAESVSAEDRNIESPSFWRALGSSWELWGDFHRAEIAYTRALHLAPEDQETRIALGSLSLRQWVLYRENRWLPEELRNREMTRWQKRAKKVLGGISSEKSESEERLSLYRAIAENLTEEAIRICRNQLTRDPEGVGSEEFWFWQGVLGGEREAMRCATRALERRGQFLWGRWLRAQIRSGKREEGALKDYARVFGAAPGFWWGRIERGRLRGLRGDPSGAEKDLAIASRQYSGSSLPLFLMGEIRQREGERFAAEGKGTEARAAWTGAVRSYTEAIHQDPDFVQARFQQALTWSLLGDRIRARSGFTDVLELDPECAKAYINRALIHRQLGETEKAMKDCDRAVFLSSDPADALFMRGFIRQEYGHYRDAVGDYTEVLRTRPGYAEAYFNRANAKMKLRDPAGAIADYSRAIRLKPGMYKAYVSRGMAFRSEGQGERQIDDYRRVLELAPANWGGRREIESFLGRLEGGF